MLINKSILKEILNEELSSDNSKLLVAINNLAGKIEDLDVSIDYLAGSISGESPVTLGYAQKSMGRFANIGNNRRHKDIYSHMRMQEIEEIIREELQALLHEEET